LLALGDTPATYLQRIFFSLSLLLFVFWQLYLLRFRGEDRLEFTLQNALAVLVLAPAGICFAFYGRDFFPDGAPVIALALGIINLFRLNEPEHRLPRLVIAFVLAVLALAKGTLLFTVIAACLCLVVRRVTDRRSKLDSVVALACSVLALWLISGNALTDFPSYLWATKEVASGFTTAMQVGARLDIQTRGLLLLLSVLTALRYAIAISNTRLSRWLAGFLVLLIGGILTKHATDRFDGHVFAPSFVFLALSFTSVFLPNPGRNRSAKYLAAASIVLSFFVLNFALRSQAQFMSAKDRVAWLFNGQEQWSHLKNQVERLRNVPELLKHHPEFFAAANQRIGKGLPEVLPRQTVDIYSYKQGGLISRNFNFHPRPVFQSYSAYTPWLARKNRDFLRSSDAPERIFFAIDTIDSRLASMEDGLSWAELITRYELRNAFTYAGVTHLDLLKRTTPGNVKVQAKSENSIDIERWHDVPIGGIVWVTAEPTSKSLVKVLRAQLIKSPTYWIELELASGAIVRKRVIEPLFESGFLLSPYVDSSKDFLLMADNERPIDTRHQVKRFRITCGKEGTCPTSSWLFSFESQRFNETPSWSAKTLEVASPNSSVLQALESGVITENAVTIREEEGRPVLHAPAMTASVVLAKDLGLSRAKHVEVCFGILPFAYLEGTTDGVEFEIQEDTPEGWRRTVWKQRLDPKKMRDDRGEHCTSIALSGEQTELAFITSPGASTDWDFSYWSHIKRLE